MSTPTETLRAWAVREVVEDRRARAVVGVLAFVLATSFGAQVAVPVPLTPVPMTLQTLFVVLAGVVLGPWLGAGAMASYVAVGLAGAPVFSAGGAGPAWLLGPTGGYLVALPAAAFVAGLVAGRGGTVLRTLAGLALGLFVVYVGGVAQLLLLTGRGLGEVLALGVLPFLVGDVIKVLLALLVARSWRPASLGRS